MKSKKIVIGLFLVVMGLATIKIQGVAKEMFQNEQVGNIDDPQFSGIVEELISETFTTYARRYDLNWKVAKRKRCYTPYFSMTKGETIVIDLKFSKTVKTGIIGMDGNVRYLQGTKVFHAFDITKSMNYCIFVQNDNNVSITANGYYVR